MLTLLLLLSCGVPALGLVHQATAVLDEGTFIGVASGNTTSFLGIPFAQPPIGSLRFRLPVPNSPFKGLHNATQFGDSCIQQNGTRVVPSNIAPGALTALSTAASKLTVPESEDCLTINVIKPSNASPNEKLPILVWIYGGGDEQGGTSGFDGGVIVKRSIALKEPILYVSMNYRLSALGFSASKETQKAGVTNLGLHDQRVGLQWIQKYIHAFGGDLAKVTIWGESAGATAVSLHMLINNGNTEGLFRAAIMSSGTPPPRGNVSEGQPQFDAFVAATGCSGSPDVLECLRRVPLSEIKAAQDASPFFFGPMSLNIVWSPRVDGDLIKTFPLDLVLQGSVANVPFITGNCDDEGTKFSLAIANLTTDTEVLDFIRNNYLTTTSTQNLTRLLELYPSDPTLGSPYDTGDANAIAPQFKRISSLQGDMIFHALRRFFLQQRSGKQPTFSFLTKRLKSVPDLGAFHGTDLENAYGPGDMTDYFVRFVATLNPNGNTGIFWPRYTNESPQLLTFLDGPTPLKITNDDFRIPQMELLVELLLDNPF
ncbi:Alpha/Beta hydrolase protein [Gloeopeniophorella convolvens]|nr:Alpha/Beta hydrolase protein [Gloeopeniophorella convolvens]